MRLSTDLTRPSWRQQEDELPRVDGLPWLVSGRTERAEILDGDAFNAAELAANFRDIRRVNQWFGGVSTVLDALPLILPPDIQRLTVLDLATGVADIPIAIEQWCDARTIPVEILATDVSPDVLAIAGRQVADSTHITLRQVDARDAPFCDRSFDVVICSLALHHFAPADATRVLREMNRLARCGFIVNDLRRGAVGYCATWLASRVTTRNRLTRHDAPLSIRRAYTPIELRGLLNDAGIRGAAIRETPWFRMVAVKRVNDG